MNSESATTEQLDLVRRVNNYLTVCVTHAEAALDSEHPAEMAEALRWILAGARDMAPRVGAGIQRELPFAAARRKESA